MVLAVLLSLGATAFAEMRSVWEWNEQEQRWEARIYEVKDDVPCNLDPEEIYRQMYPEGDDSVYDEIIARLNGRGL